MIKTGLHISEDEAWNGQTQAKLEEKAILFPF